MSTSEVTNPTLNRRRPFLRRAALRSGMSLSDLLQGHRKLLGGVYIAREVVPNPAHRVEAALLVSAPNAWASHVSAARLRKIVVPPYAEEHVSVTRQQDRRRRTGVINHLVAPPSDGEIVTVDGMRTSSPIRLFLELAEMLTFVDLVIAGDQLARFHRLDPATLVSACRTSPLPGAGAALCAARYVRAKVDSPMETRTRLLIVLAGLPEPEINVEIRDADGRTIRIYDLTYRVSRTVIEYDGKGHVEREAQWEADIGRRSDTEDDGYRMITLISRDIHVTPEETLTRIHRVLLQRGEPGVPRRLRDDWRLHFPVR